MAKLRCVLVDKGILVEYPVDRAAIDVGVHLWVEIEGKKQVVGARVWFQAKGFHATTVTLADYEDAVAIATPSLELDHVRYWYSAPEPVYLVVYVEAADVFLAADVRELVDESGGLASIELRGKSTTTFKIPKTDTLDRVIERMPRHRSMRIDGPAWRGRPLGHGIDPLRSALAPMPSELFLEVMSDLLLAHDFRQSGPAGSLRDGLSAEKPTVLSGQMFLTYEWVLPMTTEFGFDEGSEFRIEGAPLHAQGNVLVVIDPIGNASPDSVGVDINEFAKQADADRVLVMSNTKLIPAQFGRWSAGLRDDGLKCLPQDLASLTFNVLTTTNVFLKYHDRLSFEHRHYL